MAKVTFYLKNPKAKNKSAIYASFAYNGKRLQTPTNWSINGDSGHVDHPIPVYVDQSF